MTLRTVMPHPVKTAGRAVSVRLGTATAPRRQLPGFILVGAQRAGTTSLFRALMSHPAVFPANFHKGVNYFDVNYTRPFSWYQGHFPSEAYLRRHSRGTGVRPVTFEASGYYLFHPCAAERMARHLPDVRILAMLRDPVERAYSAWKHESARGFETETFERALELEDDRLAGEVHRIQADRSYYSHAHRHHAYRRRGEYVVQLQRILDFFPTAQVHTIDSETFFERPEDTYAGVLDFLDLPQVLPDRFDRWNGRPSSPMEDATRARLLDHFRGPDEALAALLGRRPAWVP